MFVPAHWAAIGWGTDNWRAEPTFTNQAWLLLGALMGIVKLFGDSSKASVGQWWLMTLCVFYCLCLLGTWWPVLVRSPRWWINLWRCLSVALLLPWYFYNWDLGVRAGRPPPGPGNLIWASGSTLICLSVLNAPPYVRPAAAIRSAAHAASAGGSGGRSRRP
jgi:hypothetical protein